MVATNVPISDDGLGRGKKTDVITILHRIVCILCTIIAFIYLLRCCCSFACAMDDLRVYEGLGFSYPFSHYLNENMFIETVRMFLPVFLEFLAYYILCRKSKKSKSFFSCILYFYVMLVLHTVIWLHARSLDFPKFPPYITADGVRFDYYIYAITSIWTSATYLIMYLLRTWKHRSK